MQVARTQLATISTDATHLHVTEFFRRIERWTAKYTKEHTSLNNTLDAKCKYEAKKKSLCARLYTYVLDYVCA